MFQSATFTALEKFQRPLTRKPPVPSRFSLLALPCG